MEVSKIADFEVSKIAASEDLVSEVTGEVLEELKERMWKDVWKENIDLPHAKVEVVRVEGVGFRITAKI